MKRSLITMLAAVIGVGSLAFLAERTANADQAAWNSRRDSARAVRLLAEAEAVIHFCAPCGDTTSRREKVESIGIAQVEPGSQYWEVQVNGEGVDLAYLYFQDKKGRWKNAAMEASIKVSDVPKYLPEHLVTE
jgi:hypothetical protein